MSTLTWLLLIVAVIVAVAVFLPGGWMGLLHRWNALDADDGSTTSRALPPPGPNTKRRMTIEIGNGNAP